MFHHRARIRNEDRFTVSVSAAGIELDRSTLLARRGDRFLRLTPVELRLLDVLRQNAGVTLSRRKLLELLWGHRTAIDLRTIDVHIGRLRKAVTLGGSPDPIGSVRGKGYQFKQSADKDYADWLALPRPKRQLVRSQG